MNKNKRRIMPLVFSLMLLCTAAVAILAGGKPTSAKTKNGCYVFGTNGQYSWRFNGKYMIVKGAPNYKKKSFPDYGGKKANKTYKFKLASKVYCWDSEDPAHKVKKFGVSFYVSHSKTIRKRQLSANGSPYGLAPTLYIIVKKGKLVSVGASA